MGPDSAAAVIGAFDEFVHFQFVHIDDQFEVTLSVYVDVDGQATPSVDGEHSLSARAAHSQIAQKHSKRSKLRRFDHFARSVDAALLQTATEH